MNKIQLFSRRLFKDTRGANLVEYIILVGVVALLCIGAYTKFGGKIQSTITTQGDTVGKINAVPGS